MELCFDVMGFVAVKSSIWYMLRGETMYSA